LIVASSAGLLLVLEGGEGVGKTTQWQRLATRLTEAGLEVLALREPGGTPSGDRIRTLLLDPASELSPTTESLLFAASRAELVAQAVRPALARGVIVLLDRYLLSTYVYQGVARGVPMDGLRAINQFATGGLVPDCTLLLHLPLDEALARTHARGAPDRLEQEARSFHERVARGFEAAGEAVWQSAHPECGPIVPVSAAGSLDEVAARCIAVLSEKWPSRFGGLLALA
jgi:dTMP kinase